MTVEYENGKPVRLDSVVVSCQHTEEKDLKKLEAEIRKKVLLPALRPLPPDEETKIYINPSGRFVCGGLDADTGLTGRKLMGRQLWKHGSPWRWCIFRKGLFKSGSFSSLYG